MITYAYWALVFVLAIAALSLIGGKLDNWKAGFIATAIILIVGWSAYYFHFQQQFVKNYGGVMSIEMPKGYQHIVATWKDDHLWVESYDPVTDTCHFNEYSKGNLLQGKVTIKNCKPVSLNRNTTEKSSPQSTVP